MNSDSDQESGITKRQRVSKACDFCRRKKTKCNGQLPCTSCITNKLSCHYANETRKMKRKAPTGGVTLRNLENRLERIEKLLKHLAPNTPDSSEEASDEKPQEEDIDDFNSDGGDNMTIHDPHLTDRGQIFVSAHESCSVFSPMGLSWVGKKLGPEGTNEVALLRKALILSRLNFKNHSQKLVENQDWTQPLPEDWVLFAFADAFIKSEIFVGLLSDDEVMPLIYKYVAARRDDTLKSLTDSDNLVLSMILTIGCFLLVHAKELCQSLEITREQLEQCELDLVAKGLHYFHKVSLNSDGLNSLIGIILLALYSETKIITPNYFLIGASIRLAQEFGLHRKEIYASMKPGEAFKRKLIWGYCNIMDKNTCIKLGLPPMISQDDFNYSYVVDLRVEMTRKYADFFENVDPHDTKQFTERLDELSSEVDHAFGYLNFFSTLQFSDCEHQVYDELLSGKSLVNKRSFSFSTVKKIITATEKLSAKIQKSKDGLPNSFNFCGNDIKEKLQDYASRDPKRFMFRKAAISLLLLRYYYCETVINRLCFTIMWKYKYFVSINKSEDPNVTRVQQAFNKAVAACLLAAASTLQILIEFDAVGLGLRNIYLLYVLTSTVTIFTNVMSFPKNTNNVELITSIIDMEDSFFSPNAYPQQFYGLLQFIFSKLITICLKIIKKYHPPEYFKLNTKITNFLKKNQKFIEEFETHALQTQPELLRRHSIVVPKIEPNVSLSHPNISAVPLEETFSGDYWSGQNIDQIASNNLSELFSELDGLPGADLDPLNMYFESSRMGQPIYSTMPSVMFESGNSSLDGLFDNPLDIPE